MLVSPEAVKAIVDESLQNGTYFICHKATVCGQDVCCRNFYDKLGDKSNLIRIAQRLGVVEFVELPEDKGGFISYNEQKMLDNEE